MINERRVSLVKLKDFNSKDGYRSGVSRFTEIAWYLVKVVFFLSAIPYPSRIKAWLLRYFGAKVGSGVVIKPRVNIHKPWLLELGCDSWIGEEVFILNFELIKIGNNVCISQRSFLCGGNHDFRDPAFRYRNGPIDIMNGAWIGASCFVGPNVTIGVDSVVVAGSVVTVSLQDNGIYRGNPALFVKNRWI